MNRLTTCGKVFVCLLLMTAAGGSAYAANTATFVRTDASTQGNWAATYGADGYSFSTSAQSQLVNVSSFFPQNAASWVWTPSTTDPRALKAPSSGATPAATWYNNPGFYFDITIAPGQSEQVALYALDWDFDGRSETLQVVDGDTNAPLDIRPLSNFTSGVYVV